MTGGRITLDGEDIALMPRQRLRELVSVAFEEPTLFSATVGDNVRMGAESADGAALLRALDVAQADFVQDLPHGVHTEVGEQGLSLSGGQRQRLALARAVVGGPRFLVLDDPLSALDVHTEALVEAALRRVLDETTALVVAHRPSTVMLADRVALISDGRITAVGTSRTAAGQRGVRVADVRGRRGDGVAVGRRLRRGKRHGGGIRRREHAMTSSPTTTSDDPTEPGRDDDSTVPDAGADSAGAATGSGVGARTAGSAPPLVGTGTGTPAGTGSDTVGVTTGTAADADTLTGTTAGTGVVAVTGGPVFTPAPTVASPGVGAIGAPAGAPGVEASPDDDPFAQDALPAPRGATGALLRSLLRARRGRVAVTALLLLLQQAAVQAGPLLVAYAIDRGVPAFRADDNGPLIAVAVGYLLCAAGAGVFQYAFIRSSARVNQDVLLDLRGRIFRHAQALSVDFHERYTSGRLISRSTTDVESLRELLAEGLQELVAVVLAFVYISAMLLYLDLGIGGLAVLSFVPLYALVRLYQRRAGAIFGKRSTAIAAVIVKFAETMNGIRPVQAFRRERANDAEFHALNHHHERTNGDAILEMARYVIGSRLTANIAVAGIVLWGAFRVADGTLALGVLAASVLFLRRLYDPIDRLGMFLNSYQSAAASLEKIAGLLAQTPSVPEAADPARCRS